MNKELEYSKLKKKILEKLDQDKVESVNEVISLYDLVEILKLHTKEYKEIYNNDLMDDIDKINKKSRIYNLFGENFDEVRSINFDFDSSNGISYPVLKITFKNGGNLMISTDCLCSDLFYKSHKKTLDKYLDTLSRFVSEYPLLANTDVNWFNKSKNIVIDDGFIKCKINLNNVNRTAVTLSNRNDFDVALVRKNNIDRELYEYIEFYNQVLQKRTAVNINSLSPSIRYIVKHYYNLDKPIIHTLK